MKIYGDLISGNCYKIKLLCALLGISHEWIAMDIMAGDTRTEDFLDKNPNGKIPLLELEDGRFIAESNAILFYLAYGSELMPIDRYLKAKVLEWLFFEQYSHEPYIAVRRFIHKYQGMPTDRQAEYAAKEAGGIHALNVMEKHLNSNMDYFVGQNLTIADISLFSYTHVADEGGFDLGAFPAIQVWLDRVRTTPGFIPMPPA
jgi:glutathione S-transferase